MYELYPEEFANIIENKIQKIPFDTRTYLRTRNYVSAEVCFPASRDESLSTIALTAIQRNIMEKNNGRGKNRGLCLIN